LFFHPLPQDDPKQRKPDISKAERLLGWQPTVDLRAGLLKTIEYMRGKASLQNAEGEVDAPGVLGAAVRTT
jgi:nucleoside-diphosphate-sugar epimerase